MSYGLWLSAGGMQVNQYRQEIIANNLANVETAGFKRDLAVIHERRVESQTSALGPRFGHALLDRLSGGNWVRPTYTDFDQGGLVATGGNLDAAVEGEGFFTVRAGNELRYTRDGRFTLNKDGELVMAAGKGRFKVLDDGSRRIVLDRDGPEIRIGRDGSISQGKRVVAKLGVAEFADPQSLRKVGENVFVNTGGRPNPASRSQVHGGFVEQSAQNPVSGLVELIEVSRAHDLNARMISIQDRTIGQAVNTVGRVS